MNHRLAARYPHEYLLAFLIPFCILLLTFYRLGIYPFGDVSVMLYDMPVQYVNYFGWLSNVLHGDGNLSYSLAKGFGGGMASTYAYYLSSPFNLLVLFFDAAHIPELFSVLYLLKIPAAAVTCLVFLRGRFAKDLEVCESRVAVGIPLIIFACAYALMTYVIGYASNIMWLDGVIMLPLVSLGVYRLVKDGRCLLLFVSATCAILFNWYTGYMVCLFSILYVFYELYRTSQHPFGRRLWRYAATMCCAVGASAVLMVPNVLALLAGKGSGAGLNYILTTGIYLNPLNLLNYACVGTFPGIVSSNKTPAIAISACILLMAFFYFFLPRIPKREKRASLILLLVLGASLVFAAWANVWTGFKDAPSYMERNSFVVSFFMVLLAGDAWLYLLKIGSRHLLKRMCLACGVLIGAFLLSTLYRFVMKGSWFPSPVDVVLEVSLLAVYAALLMLIASRRPRLVQVVCALFVCVFLFEGAYNTENLLGLCHRTVSSYSGYIDEMKTVCSPLEGEEADRGSSARLGQAGFYYMGTKWNGTDCESLLFGVSAFDHYSSTQESDIQDLLTHLGYMKTAPFGTYYSSPLLVADDLLGVNYIIDDAQPALTSVVDGVHLPREGYTLYRNDDALPLGYGIPATSGSVEWTDDPFANQELLVGDMAGLGSKPDLYTAQEVFETEAPDVSSRSWAVTVSQNGPLYAFTDRINTDATNTGGIECDLLVNGTLVQQVGGRTSCNIVCLGTYAAGEKVTITLTPLNPQQSFKSQDGTRYTAKSVFYDAPSDSLLDVRSLDIDAFERAKAKIDSRDFSIDSLDDGSLDATFTARSDETLFISLPYDAGWSAWVDGAQVQVSEVYGGFIGIPVHAGENTIELRYQTPGFTLGVVISLSSILIFGLWQLVERRRR